MRDMLKDEAGKRYGRLTVIARAPNAKHGQAQWICRCDCGNTAVVRGSVLRNGHTRSCSCVQREVVSAHRFEHGHSRNRSPTYQRWKHMHGRCTNPANPDYKNYGGRGIAVCEQWQSFPRFLADMGECPREFTIERIDNDRGYEPGNCKWAPRSEQNQNKRNNRMVTLAGRTQCVQAWRKERGIANTTLYRRLKNGWPIERALEPLPQSR